MFKCDECKKDVGPRERPVLLYNYRAKTYGERVYTQRGGRVVLDPGGSGTEIAGQRMVCAGCVEK